MAQNGIVPGVFNTGNFTDDLAVKDFASMILRYQPNGSAPLFAMTSQADSETATNTEHGYFAKAMIFPSVELTADITQSATTIKVDSTAQIIEGTILMFEATQENVWVTAVVDDTTLTVTRGIGGGASAITISADPKKAYKIGNANEEASLRPNALAITPVKITNLTQIFRNTYAISGTAESVAVIAGDATASENRRDAATLHATDIEFSLIFGKKATGTRNGQPVRFMDGIINIISDISYYPASYSAVNVFDASSSGTDSVTLEGYLDNTLNQVTDATNPNVRIMFVGGKAHRVINQICRLNGEYQLLQEQSVWGLRFETFRTARGDFKIVEHPLFNTNDYFSKMALVVDPGAFGLAYLGNRKTQDKKFNQKGDTVAQDNGIDATGGTLLTEVTALVKNPPSFALIRNLTKGLKDS